MQFQSSLLGTTPTCSLATRAQELSNVSPQLTTLKPAEIQPNTPSRLAGKEFLPGSTGEGFPEVLSPPTETFPHAVRVDNPGLHSMDDCIISCRQYLQENLSHYGAVLLRNLPLKTAADFSRMTQGLGYKGMTYQGGAVEREELDSKSGTYTASDEPPQAVIEPHNEMAYSPVYPPKLLFFCQQEPEEDCGGETPLVKSSDILSRLDPKVLQTFADKKVRYVRYAPPRGPGAYLPWQDVFMTEDPKTAEHFLQQKGFSYKWEPSGALFYWQVLPAFLEHPETGETVWFNQIQSHHASHLQGMPRFKGSDLPTHHYSCQTYYGDGSEIEPAVLQHIRAVTWSCAVGFRWRNGDVLVVDNLAAQHARMSFTGPRRILAVLSEN
ncbi:hypothetical protein ACROYT_G037021 [Oculina patagonica]